MTGKNGPVFVMSSFALKHCKPHNTLPPHRAHHETDFRRSKRQPKGLEVRCEPFDVCHPYPKKYCIAIHWAARHWIARHINFCGSDEMLSCGLNRKRNCTSVGYETLYGIAVNIFRVVCDYVKGHVADSLRPKAWFRKADNINIFRNFTKKIRPQARDQYELSC